MIINDWLRLSIPTLVCRVNPRRRVVDGSPRVMSGSPCGGEEFVDTRMLGLKRAIWFSCVGRTRRFGRDNVSTMNGAVRGRRLASPVRLALALELGTSLDGAWWPRTASIARELPELIDALSTRLGEIIAISVNWSSLEGSPVLDGLNRAKTGEDSGRIIGHQRLMMVTGSLASANLLVVPCRTPSALAVMVLRQAATLPIYPVESGTQEFRAGDDIVRAARAESTVCARRRRVSGLAQVGSADPVM